jgi:hypothetical protein
MSRPGQSPRGAQAACLARGAADWLLDGATADPADLSLYHGPAGVVLALHEAHQHFGDDRYGRAARGADALSAQAGGVEDCSLYFGLAGIAVALRALGRDAAASRALGRVRDRFDGQRWNQMFELLTGNAGIGLGALQAGDLDSRLSLIDSNRYHAQASAHRSPGNCIRIGRRHRRHDNRTGTLPATSSL